MGICEKERRYGKRKKISEKSKNAGKEKNYRKRVKTTGKSKNVRKEIEIWICWLKRQKGFVELQQIIFIFAKHN